MEVMSLQDLSQFGLAELCFYWTWISGISEFSVEESARIHKVTSRHLRRYFVTRFGISAQDWMQNCRMIKARNLLRTNMSCKEISFLLNYSYTSHFCRSFRRTYGITPEHYRTLQKTLSSSILSVGGFQ